MKLDTLLLLMPLLIFAVPFTLFVVTWQDGSNGHADGARKSFHVNEQRDGHEQLRPSSSGIR
jgi:hypothetical protein